ncbi:hypothetical protein ACJRO7_010533 [Eucalyptus globulus]|uniref:DUF4283 domain-containing protein n=1 Tax=Eucalyptus globulus TaxID=34317 RepID=A0ABD3LC99_EUCGL
MASSSDPMGPGNGMPQTTNGRSRSRARNASRGREGKRPDMLNRGRSKAPQTRSWANVASLSAKGYELDFAPPVSVGKKSVVQLSDNARCAGDPKWNNCLVGYYVGKNVPFRITETALKHTWGSHLSEVLANDDGFYFFIIPDNEFRRKVLDEGHITVARVPLVLKQWHKDMELKKELQSTVPVWIRLKDIPFAYWSSPGISEIASAVGKPLYVDSLTEKMKRLSFARVCVEISAKLERYEEVEVWVDEKVFSVQVLYEWRPNSCMKCCAFGHNCLAKEIPKQTPVSVEPPSGAAKSTVPPGNEELDQLMGWKQVLNRKKNHQRGQKVDSTPPISALKANAAAELVSSSSVVDAQNEQIMMEAANAGPSMALVVQNTDSTLIPSSEEDVSAVSSSSEEEEDLVPAVQSQDPHDTPSSQQEAHISAVATPSKDGQKGSSMDTPSIASRKGTNRRKPPRRALGDPVRQAEIRNFVRSNNLCCVGIVETKVSAAAFNSVTSVLLPGWSWVNNYNYSHKGRIWVGWNPREVDFLVNASSVQAIHGRLLWLVSGKVLFLSVVYAEHRFVSRRPLWEDLIQTSVRDFNAIRDPSDRIGSSNAWIPAFDEFRDCLVQAGLDDLRYTGYRYTWATLSGINRKQRKIDRVLVNARWNSEVSFSEASFIAPGISDHTPMVIKVMPVPKSSKPFKFFNFWMTHSDFFRMVSEVWESPFHVTPMFTLCAKLRLL